MHKLVKTLVDKGLSVNISKEGYSLEGFYKSGSVIFNELNENTLLCHQRYDEVEEVSSFDDIVRVNFKWWQRSKARGWGNPEEFWLQEFIRLDLVTVKTITVVEEK